MRIVLHIHGEIQNQIMGMTRLIATDSWSGKLMKAKLGQWSRQRKNGFQIFRSHQRIYCISSVFIANSSLYPARKEMVNDIDF